MNGGAMGGPGWAPKTEPAEAPASWPTKAEATRAAQAAGWRRSDARRLDGGGWGIMHPSRGAFLTPTEVERETVATARWQREAKERAARARRP